jgi:hypothetical protein
MAGRPKKQADEKRANFLRIRLTQNERDEIDGAAKRKGLDTSSWARSELLALARRMSRS